MARKRRYKDYNKRIWESAEGNQLWMPGGTHCRPTSEDEENETSDEGENSPRSPVPQLSQVSPGSRNGFSTGTIVDWIT